ncbi:MAG: hypothetical protein ACRCS3_06725 [Paracoccaceae bacterium]
MNGLQGFAQAFVLLLALTGTSFADVVRCTVTDRNHRLAPEWIEYEILARGTTVAVRDATGAAMNVDWVTGKIQENSARRLTIKWSNGHMPQQDGWWRNGQILMTLTRLRDGSYHLTGTPTTAFANTRAYSGTVTCSS